MAIRIDDDLFPEARNPPDTQVINPSCLRRTQNGHCLVIAAGVVLAQYAIDDRMAEAHAMVSLVERGWANQNEVARAFGCAARTVRRNQRRFEDGGLAALGQPRGYPNGRPRVVASRRRMVQQLKAQGHSNCEIARRLGVSEKAIRKLLHRMGWKSSVPEPSPLPLDFGQSSTQNCPLFPHPLHHPHCRAASTPIRVIAVRPTDGAPGAAG